jgi:hypothetical protein
VPKIVVKDDSLKMDIRMDNVDQLEEIQEYREHLSSVVGKEVDDNTAAFIWIRKNAQTWRLKHPLQQPGYSPHY